MAGFAAPGTPSGGDSNAVRMDRARRGVQRVWRAVQASLRAIIGAPDYERYLDHVGRAHPGECPLTREQFAARHLDRRYNRVGGRCC